MTALLKGVLTTSSNHRSNKEIIYWWEQRRIFYNAVMLAAGCLTILLALLLHEIKVTELFNVLPPILIFAFSANLFYTLGWITEIACHKFISQQEAVQKTGPVLFIAGICISVLFTLAIDVAIVIAFFFN